jgi:GNAT superfamily N-acetyltransferase
MAIATGVTTLERKQTEDAGRVLSRAFWDDPAAMYVMPDDAVRAEKLTWFMSRAAAYGSLFGEVFTTAAKVDGAAIWLPPGEWEMPEERMGEAGFGELAEVLGDEGMGRFENMFGHMEGLHSRDVPEPHWYLFILGVDPPRQGQGVGGSLIQPILQRADADCLPCYLETMKARNVPFYRKHGFEVVVDELVPKGGPRLWTMKRQPK